MLWFSSVLLAFVLGLLVGEFQFKRFIRWAVKKNLPISILGERVKVSKE